MALYPKATKRLIPGQERRPRQKPQMVALHTAVDGPNTKSLYGYTSGKGNAKFHFYVMREPDRNGNMVEQYMDTMTRGAAMRYADGESIVIESWDGMAGRWRGAKTWPEWNQQQIEALVDLVTWCCDTHHIPKELAQPNTNYSRSNWRRWVLGVYGISYHSQPARNSSYNMVPGRFNPWTKFQGKVCPGHERVLQTVNVIIPLVQGNDPVTVEIPEDQYGKIALGLGDEGPAVEKLQRILNERHSDLLEAIDVDGDFGPMTDLAVRVIQEALKVTVDGYWGPNTEAASFTMWKRTNDISILGPDGATKESALAWAEAKGADGWFKEYIEVIYSGGLITEGVNRALALAQSAVETGFGRFGGNVQREWNNPAGIKITNSDGLADSDPAVWFKFDSLLMGAQAHIDHLALYAGVTISGRQTPDPRHFDSIRGTATTLHALNSRWDTVTPTYSELIEKHYRDLITFQKDSNTEEKSRLNQELTELNIRAEVIRARLRELG